jgi:hypothetical protein
MINQALTRLPTPPRDYRREHQHRDPVSQAALWAIDIGLITKTEAIQLLKAQMLAGKATYLRSIR